LSHFIGTRIDSKVSFVPPSIEIVRSGIWTSITLSMIPAVRLMAFVEKWKEGTSYSRQSSRARGRSWARSGSALEDSTTSCAMGKRSAATFSRSSFPMMEGFSLNSGWAKWHMMHRS